VDITNNAEIKIGRHKKNTIVIRQPLVSRVHAIIHKGIIVDSSTNGTRVNSKLIREHILKPGDVIQISSMELKVRNGTAHAPQPKTNNHGYADDKNSAMPSIFDLSANVSVPELLPAAKIAMLESRDKAVSKYETGNGLKSKTRASRACEICHSRKLRCEPNGKTGKPFPCRRCDKKGHTCIPYRPGQVSRQASKIVDGPSPKTEKVNPGNKALADHLNRHKGVPCKRNPFCLRPFKHPGHCRTLQRTPKDKVRFERRREMADRRRERLQPTAALKRKVNVMTAKLDCNREKWFATPLPVPPKKRVKGHSFQSTPASSVSTVSRPARGHACVYCHNKRLRCAPNEINGKRNPCQRCVEMGIALKCKARSNEIFIPPTQSLRESVPSEPTKSYQGPQCIRSVGCLRPYRHPGHCRNYSVKHYKEKKRAQVSSNIKDQRAPRFECMLGVTANETNPEYGFREPEQIKPKFEPNPLEEAINTAEILLRLGM